MNLTPIQLGKPPKKHFYRTSEPMLALQQALQALTPDSTTAIPWPKDAFHHHNTPYRAARAIGVRISLINHPDHGRIIVRTA